MTRTYGQGSITLERGRYRVRVPDGRGGHLHIGSYDTEIEAEQHRAAALAVRAESGLVPTLRAYGERWLVRDVLHQRNRRTWEGTWRGLVLRAPFADDPLDAITTRDVDAWTRQLVRERARRSVLQPDGTRRSVELERPISRQTAHHALGLLRRCLAAAEREGHVERNPADGARLPRTSAPARGRAAGEPVTYLSAAEVEQLLGCAALPDEQRAVFALAVLQGLREGEIAALRWERIEWTEHGWWISASWDGAPGSTKSGRARWQALLPRAEIELRAWWRLRGEPDRGLVFPARRGRAPIQRGYSARERPYARGFDWGWADHPAAEVTRLGWWRRAGITTCVRLHDLRDTCATHLLSGTWTAERWDLLDVSRHLGHTDPRVTAQRYAHLTRDAQRQAARARAVPTPAAELPQQSGENVAFPGGFEPPTRGLGSSRSTARSAEKAGLRADPWQVCGRLARALIAGVAAGREIAHTEVEALVAAAGAALGAASGHVQAEPRTLQLALRLALVLDEEARARAAAQERAS